MTDNNKYTPLYIKAALLGYLTKKLRKRSLRYYVFLAILLFIFGGGYLIAALFAARYLEDASVFVKNAFPILVLIIQSLFMTIDHLLRKQLLYYYDEAHNICSELSDLVDWTALRKHQVYNRLEPRIQIPIDDFYSYSLSVLCPFHGGKIIRDLIYFTYMIGMVSFAVYIIFFFLR